MCGSKGLFKVFFTMQEASSIKGSTSTSIHYHKDIFKVPKASTCQPRLLQGFQDSIKPSITMQATNDHRMGHLAHLLFQRLLWRAKGFHELLHQARGFMVFFNHLNQMIQYDITCGVAWFLLGYHDIIIA